MFHIFHFSKSDMVFGIIFVESLCLFQREKLLDYDAFPVNSHWSQDRKVFPACWILIGQFKFPARQPYAAYLGIEKGYYYSHCNLTPAKFQLLKYFYYKRPPYSLDWVHFACAFLVLKFYPAFRSPLPCPLTSQKIKHIEKQARLAQKMIIGTKRNIKIDEAKEK